MGLLSFGRHKDDAAGDDNSALSATAGQDAAGTRPKARRKTRAADPIDPVLPEKQRARRRLVGAVALVLAAVIGLPMILDPEPKPLASDISVDIPSKDKARPAAGASANPPAMAPAAAALDQREEIVNPDATDAAHAAPGKAGAPGTPTTAAATGGAATGSAAVAGKAEAAKADAGKPLSGKAETGKADPNKPEAKPDVRADAKPEARSEHKAEPKAELKADLKAEPQKADDARARAILDGRDAAARHEAYMVQVAALASADKVHELQNRLKAAGIKSQTQKVATQSGERIRVRVGPLQGRAEAEKMRTRLNKLGLNGTLVPA